VLAREFSQCARGWIGTAFETRDCADSVVHGPILSHFELTLDSIDLDRRADDRFETP
jgi:hypothetical protein